MTAAHPIFKPDQGPSLCKLAPVGRLTELSGRRASSRYTAAVSMVLTTQVEGEPVAWLQMQDGGLYPPDLVASGIDFDALVVVRVPGSYGTVGLLKSAELLLRSGAWGLVVVDLTDGVIPGVAWQSRFLALAREHQSRVVLLTEKSKHHGSLGPLIGLQLEVTHQRLGPQGYQLQTLIQKNKVGLNPSIAPEQRRVPWGMM